MGPTIPDGGQGGHLYKFVTVLGAFVALISLYGFNNVVHLHDERLQENIGKVLDTQDSPPEMRKFWTDYLAAKKRHTETISSFLLYSAISGAAVFVAGTSGWYWKVQRFEDVRRVLENDKLKLESGRPR